MDAIILSIGTELTCGQTVDTNTAWLAAQLSDLGIVPLMHVTVSDDIEPIRREIARACAAADAVLLSGGLGPTEDDQTRQALAAVMGVGLVMDEASLGQIRAFFERRQRIMPEANAIQAMMPAGCHAIENTCGTAPGIRGRWDRAQIFVMPGVPREMKVMFERDVRPVLATASGGAALAQQVLWCCGAGESDIGEMIRDLMQRGANPTVGTTAQEAIIGVRVNAWGASPKEAQRMLAATTAEVRRRLGTLVFGEGAETLSTAVAKLLTARKLTIATAESCTGGLIAKRLTDVAGSSKYFLEGVTTYTNAAKVRLLNVDTELLASHGAVSKAVATAMAVNCRRIAGTDLAVSVTGVAGPTGGTAAKPVGLVYIGLTDAKGCVVTEHRLGERLTREEIRDRTAKVALNRLRLHLLG